VNWDNIKYIPSSQEMVGSRVGGKFALKRANIPTSSSKEIVQKYNLRKLDFAIR
jgi:hypothetical protein